MELKWSPSVCYTCCCSVLRKHICYLRKCVSKQFLAYKGLWIPYQTLNRVVIKVESNNSDDKAENLQTIPSWKKKELN